MARGDRQLRDRLLPEDVDLEKETREVWLALRGDIRSDLTAALRNDTPIYWILSRLCRESDRSDPLVIIDRVIMWLASIGWPEAQIRLIETHVRSRIDQCFAGTAQPKIEELDVAEQRLEGEEGDFQIARLAAIAAGEFVGPDALEQEAQLRERIAATNLAEARALRREARRPRHPVTRKNGRIIEFTGEHKIGGAQ